MVQGLVHVTASNLPGSDEPNVSADKVALAGAAAIQRIVAERNNLRQRALAQQRELVALRAINEDLTRRIALIRHYYVELGTKILTQLEQFDEAFREIMREKENHARVSADHDNLVALAHRLRPNRVDAKQE